MPEDLIPHEGESEDDIELTALQQEAVKLGIAVAEGKHPLAILEGFAGTGKTVTTRFIAAALGGDVVICAPTGRAALRVYEATGLRGRTIHSIFYVVDETKRGSDVAFMPRIVRSGDSEISDVAEQLMGAALVIVDEASMVSEKMDLDIRSALEELGVGLLYVGDSFQLPPVTEKGAAPFSIFQHEAPRVKLTQIMRQAESNPIIRASAMVRENRSRQGLRLLGDVPMADLVDKACDVVAAKGAVICHTNKTRLALNHAIRAAFGIEGALQPAEPLLVLKNNHNLGRYNGEIVTFEGWAGAGVQWDFRASYRDEELSSLYFAPAMVDRSLVVLCINELMGTNSFGDGITAREARKCAEYHRWMMKIGEVENQAVYLAACMGYAITAHKMQGSEADQVLVVVEPSVRLEEEDGRRWIYTAITRAKKACTLGYIGRAGIQQARRKHARPAIVLPKTAAVVSRLLMVDDDGGAGSAWLTEHAPAVQPVKCVNLDMDADKLVRSFDGLVCGWRPDKLLAASFLKKSKRVFRFMGAGLEPVLYAGVDDKLEDLEEKLVIKAYDAATAGPEKQNVITRIMEVREKLRLLQAGR